ncbi:MAG: hypothetical protein ABI333_24360 [bacterium]
MHYSENAEASLLPYVKLVTPEKNTDFDNVIEEYVCQRGDVNIYMLLSTRHRHMRILDYRIGNYQLKRNMLDEFCRRKKVRKVFTLVEKQDSNSWRTVGFSREAAVPAFFRTADAYVMSRAYDEDGSPLTGGLSKISSEYTIKPPRTVRRPPGLKVEVVEDNRKIMDKVYRDGSTEFYSPFGKGLKGPELAVRAKVGRKDKWVVAEINDSFGHAKLDFLHTAGDAKELGMLVHGAESLVNALCELEVANIFGFSYVDEEMTAEAFGAAGFRNTGQLTRHVTPNGAEPVDVHVWHRRIGPKRQD